MTEKQTALVTGAAHGIGFEVCRQVALPEVSVLLFEPAAILHMGVLLLPGTLYAPGLNHFRVGFGRENLPEALARFDDYLRSAP